RHSVRDVELVHIGTGRPEYYLKIAALAEELDRSIAFDPSQEIHYVYGPRAFRALLSRATYFFGNEAEIAQARRLVRGSSTADLLRHVDVVVVTLGAKGSLVVTRSERIRIPRVRPKKVVDVTGAGDAYRAGFYAGLRRGYDLGQCGILASAVASFVVEHRGTQTNLPTWADVLARARRHASF
ncbi:MAG TPA: PfkB family carbohydrate kinase, partial [Thermoplasmata archaeon]|nr:PfkB family carbohydrate kinase [Thermoplasmata archaeon]